MSTDKHREGTEAQRDEGAKCKVVPMPRVPIPSRSVIVAAIAVLSLMTGQALAQPCGGYEVTAIIQASKCPPFGYSPTIGTGISEPINGGLPYVVGHVQSCVIGPDVAFIWTPDQGIQLIPTPPGTQASEAVDIRGTRIVGNFHLEDDGLGGLGFLYDFQTDEFTNLGTLRGGTRSEALGVNAAGQIAGYWGDNIIGPWQTFMWENGVMNDLGPLIGGTANRGLDINDNGAITGWWRRVDGGERIAFVWEDRVKTDLGPIPDGFTSEGRAINSLGDVAGFGVMFDKNRNKELGRAFAWIDGEMIMLGTLPGYPESFARGISDDRIVVGYAQITGARAFVWKDGVMTALNDLIPPELGLDVKVANAINSAGQVIAKAENDKSDVVSVVLTPIEPPLGDLDGDCTVGATDLLILLSDWGPCEGCPSDLDGNGSVGASDLLLLLANWG